MSLVIVSIRKWRTHHTRGDKNGFRLSSPCSRGLGLLLSGSRISTHSHSAAAWVYTRRVCSHNCKVLHTISVLSMATATARGRDRNVGSVSLTINPRPQGYLHCPNPWMRRLISRKLWGIVGK